MKKLLILGGFPQNIDIIMTAKEMGIFTIVVDREDSSPAKRFADKSIKLSTSDLDKLEELCKVEGVDGVFTGFEDYNIHVAKKLSKRLNLPFYATEEQLSTITDKKSFKDCCRRYEVPVVEEYTLDEAINEGKYPYIIKPVDSYGSRGITVCSREEELLLGYKKACESSQKGHAIIERFIDNDHGIELFYTIVNGKVRLTVTADRYVVRDGKTTVPLPIAEVFPSKHRAEFGELDGKIRSMIQGMGLYSGLVLVQALYKDGEIFVYEMAYRLTGEQHYRLVEKQWGVSLAKMMIKLSLGEDVSEFDTDLLEDNAFVYPSVNYAVILSEGQIGKLDGLEKVFQIDEVISYNLTHTKGDYIKPSGDYSHMLIRINMVAKDFEKLKRAISMVNDYVVVESEDGKDMVISRMNTQILEN